jgi:uncharacterized protein YbcI
MRVRTYVEPQFAVCVLRDVLTPAERTLTQSGGRADVEAARGRIADANEAGYVGIVETLTGRSVLSHTARIRVTADVAVHFFLFDARQTEPAGPTRVRSTAWPTATTSTSPTR